MRTVKDEVDRLAEQLLTVDGLPPHIVVRDIEERQPGVPITLIRERVAIMAVLLGKL